MILLWTDLKYAREIKFGKNLCGISFMNERPDIALLPYKETLNAVPNNDVGFMMRSDWIHHIVQALKSGDPINVIMID